MPTPQPTLNVEPSERVRSLRHQRQQRHLRSARSARWRALGWEMTGRLTVNLALTLVAISALVRLVPYYQTQRQVLQEMESSLTTSQTQHKRLMADFSRYFDPAQTSQVLQENGARESKEHIPVVWVDTLTEPSDTNPEADVDPKQ